MTGRPSPSHYDIWRYGDLGKTGRQVYNAVAADLPSDVASIARLTGLARSTVSRKLHALVDRGLVVRDPDTRRYQQGELEPSEAAGTGAGKHRRDQDRYAHERAAYHRRDSRDR